MTGELNPITVTDMVYLANKAITLMEGVIEANRELDPGCWTLETTLVTKEIDPDQRLL